MLDNTEDKLYIVTIREVLEREEQVYATSADSAKAAVRRMYRNEEIVLDSDDLTETEFLVDEID